VGNTPVWKDVVAGVSTAVTLIVVVAVAVSSPPLRTPSPSLIVKVTVLGETLGVVDVF
jgi:hypothetical protein